MAHELPGDGHGSAKLKLLLPGLGVNLQWLQLFHSHPLSIIPSCCKSPMRFQKINPDRICCLPGCKHHHWALSWGFFPTLKRFFGAVGDPQPVPGSLCHKSVIPPILATQTEDKNTQKSLPSPLQSLSLQQEGEPLPWRPEMPQKTNKKNLHGERALHFSPFS